MSESTNRKLRRRPPRMSVAATTNAKMEPSTRAMRLDATDVSNVAQVARTLARLVMTPSAELGEKTPLGANAAVMSLLTGSISKAIMVAQSKTRRPKPPRSSGDDTRRLDNLTDRIFP